MAKPPWDSFEWDDETRKNGNVQHLRDHDIEPEEAEECSDRGLKGKEVIESTRSMLRLIILATSCNPTLFTRKLFDRFPDRSSADPLLLIDAARA